MSQPVARERAPQYSAATIRVKVDELFSDLPEPARALLAGHPCLLELLLHCNQDLAAGAVSPRELSAQAERWSKGLPRRRRALIYLLQNFMQAELELGVPKGPRKRARSKAVSKMRLSSASAEGR